MKNFLLLLVVLLCSCQAHKPIKLPKTRMTASPYFLSDRSIASAGANFFNEDETFERMLAAKRMGINWIRLTPTKWRGAHCKEKPGCFLIGAQQHYQGLVQEDLDKLLEVLDWALELDLKVVLTFLSVPGRTFAQHNQGKQDERLWTSYEWQDEAIQFFQDVALYVGHHPALLALNPINEPAPEIVKPRFLDWYSADHRAWSRTVKDTPRDLNQFYARAVKQIRRVRANLPIVLDAGLYAHPWAVPSLVPIDDASIFYSFHWYMPFVYSQKDTRYEYPGSAPLEEHRKDAPVVEWNEARMRTILEPVRAWARLHNVDAHRIMVGEFGVDRLMKGAQQYLHDSRALFKEYGFMHAFYSFREPHFPRMDYELGTREKIYPYWQALEQNVSPHYGNFWDRSLLDALGLSPLSQKKPLKGFSTWNWFGSAIDQNLIMSIMDAMEEKGLKARGYDTIFIDGGWRAQHLSPEGRLVADSKKFPDGIKSIVDNAHARGFKIGLHIPIGTKDCADITEGSFGHERVNAEQMREWGVDVVKLDQCLLDGSEEWPSDVLAVTYAEWRKQLNDTKIEIMASASRFYRWYPRVADYGRVTLDIRPQIFGGARFSDSYLGNFLSVVEAVRQASEWTHVIRGDYFNDLDMLVIDNGLNADENRSHFAMWAIMNSPLLLGNDPRVMSDETVKLLSNEKLRAIHEDTFEAARLIISDQEKLVFRKRLQNGEVAFVFVSLMEKEKLVASFSLKELDVVKPKKVTSVFSLAKQDVSLKLNVSLAPHACEVIIFQ